MTPKTQVLVAGSAVVAFFLLTGFSTEGGHWGPRESDRARQVVRWHVEDELEVLKASNAQKQAVHALEETLFAQGEALYVEQDTTNEQMLQFWGTHNPDPKVVHALVEQRMQAFTVYAHKMADAALELHQVLTPPQRQQVEQQLRAMMNAK